MTHPEKAHRRKAITDAVKSGMSRLEAAENFAVSDATVIMAMRENGVKVERLDANRVQARRENDDTIQRPLQFTRMDAPRNLGGAGGFLWFYGNFWIEASLAVHGLGSLVIDADTLRKMALKFLRETQDQRGSMMIRLTAILAVRCRDAANRKIRITSPK